MDHRMCRDLLLLIKGVALLLAVLVILSVR